MTRAATVDPFTRLYQLVPCPDDMFNPSTGDVAIGVDGDGAEVTIGLAHHLTIIHAPAAGGTNLARILARAAAGTPLVTTWGISHHSDFADVADRAAGPGRSDVDDLYTALQREVTARLDAAHRRNKRSVDPSAETPRILFLAGDPELYRDRPELLQRLMWLVDRARKAAVTVVYQTRSGLLDPGFGGITALRNVLAAHPIIVLRTGSPVVPGQRIQRYAPDGHTSTAGLGFRVTPPPESGAVDVRPLRVFCEPR